MCMPDKSDPYNSTSDNIKTSGGKVFLGGIRCMFKAPFANSYVTEIFDLLKVPLDPFNYMWLASMVLGSRKLPTPVQ